MGGRVRTKGLSYTYILMDKIFFSIINNQGGGGGDRGEGKGVERGSTMGGRVRTKGDLIGMDKNVGAFRKEKMRRDER